MKIFFFLLMINFNSFAENYEVKTLSNHNGQSMVFEPMFLKANPGDRVKFVPVDKGHTSQSLSIPKNAKSWKGITNQEIEVVLEKEGLYLYECQNHGIMGMIGLIQVGKASNRKEILDFYEKHKKKLIMHKDRLDKYLENLK